MNAKKSVSRKGTKPLHSQSATRAHHLVKMAAIVLPLLSLTAHVRGQSALDGFDPNVNDIVRVVVVQPDGKILIGGDFAALSPNGGAAVTRNRIARLNPDGTLDTAFNPNVSTNGNYVLSIALQSDGKILVGGFFDSIGGQARHNIARLDATTGLADSFDPNANNLVWSLAVRADGKILAGGGFTSIGGQTRNRIARLDPSTGLADSFDPNADNDVLSIAVQGDGKILAGGGFASIGGQTRNRIARLNATTGLADSFDPNANNPVLSIAVQADGKILASGTFASIGGQTRNHIARVDPATGLADSFDPNSNVDVVWAVAVQADGKILAVGDFTTLAPNGGAPVTRNRIARLETDGRLDQTFVAPPRFNHQAGAIAVQPDGKILIGGQGLLRLNKDGTLDVAFNPVGSNNVNCIAIQADGKILVGAPVGLTRLNAATGSVDDSFHPSGGTYVVAIAVQADGKILIGGSGNPLSRLNPDGTDDTTFRPNMNASSLSILVQADGKILVGGFFTNVDGQTRNYIARLNPDGTLDTAFDPQANPPPPLPSYNYVSSIAVQADGKVLVCGSFTSFGGQTRNGIARLNGTTGLADSFNPNSNSNTGGRSVTVQADGKILFGGFTVIGGQEYDVFRLDGTTGLPDSFYATASGSVDGIAAQSDGKVLVGGSFVEIGGAERYDFARLSNDTAALQNLAVTRTGIAWTRGGSSPQFAHVTFESSTDDLNYTALGNGVPAGANWTLTGLNLPTGQNIYIRARGYYRSGYSNGSESITESVRNAFIARPSNLGNISTRLRIQTGDNAMIGGFIITGTELKTVIVRGIGPSLPVPGALADPVIEVHGSSGQLLATNDNWRDGQYAQQVAATLPPANDLESALWGRLDPGAYTVVVRGKNDTTGTGLFEVYDLDQTANSMLANISTRGFVETGNNVLIGGTIVIGNDPARVLLRAIGPSLTNFGVPNALQDPTLELHDGNGALLASNDNWRSDQEAEIIATGIPPTNDLESSILRDLAPGNYTAIVGGVNSTTGIAVVEAYELN